MTETQKTAKSHKAETHYTPDLSTPYATTMRFWQGEMEKFFGEAEKNFARSKELHDKLVVEQARLAASQLSATQDAWRMMADGMQRMVRATQEH